MQKVVNKVLASCMYRVDNFTSDGVNICINGINLIDGSESIFSKWNQFNTSGVNLIWLESI